MLGRRIKNFVICASHRAGGSLIAEAVHSTGRCAVPHPFLSPTFSLSLFESGQIPSHPASDFPAYIRAILAAERPKHAPFGLRTTWQDLEDFPARIGAPCPQGDLRQLAQTLLASFGPARFIWCRREDKVRQAISFLKAKQAAAPHPSPPHFDFAALHALTARFLQEDLAWESFFAANRIRPLTVSYESLAPDFHRTLSRTLRFLGLPASIHTIPDPVLNKSIPDPTSDAWHSLYHEALAKGDPHS